jgi:dipeptidyl aminopeptidase/acylaminoacyl peptidase
MIPSSLRMTHLLLATLVGFAACAPAQGLRQGAEAPVAARPIASGAPSAPASVSLSARAQNAALASSGYDKPPQNILDVLHAPAFPVPYLSPTRESMVLVSWIEYPSMARVAEPFLKLAGVRIEPKTRRRHDTPGGYGITACAQKFDLVILKTQALVSVALPPGGCAEAPSWSADGERFAFRNTSERAVELWIGDGLTGAVHPLALGKASLNPMLGSTLQWMPDQKTLLVKTVPEGAGTAPEAPVIPNGPSIQETKGEKGESSTYETRDVLKSTHDEALFDFYATTQLALIDSASGAITSLGKPGIYTDVEAAPDGEHVLVEVLRKPYSYAVTYERFAHDVQVWDRTGKILRTAASLPVADRVPVHGVRTGPRDFEWRATEPATLVWAEALDGGDWKVKVPARDKIMMHKAPFTEAAVEIMRTEQRFDGIRWGENANLAIVREDDANRHWTRAFTLNVDDLSAKPKLLWDFSSDEHYKHPGNPVYRQLANGAWVMRQEKDAIYLRGDGASPDGDRPFLDRIDLKTLKPERLFRADKVSYESFQAFTDASSRTFLTWHQSPTEAPNAFLRTLGPAIVNAQAGEATFTSTSRAVTTMPDPTPVVRAIKKRLVKYKRKDGVDLSFTLYTPPGYQEGTRVPAVLYAYPLDYADASKAGQTTGSEQTFTRLRQYKLLLLAGYAIIDSAAFPIVGDPKKAYDTYLEQLIADAQAAVDEAVKTGVVDPERIGITGHSHGALMTANLITHTDLFRAGVATSGSYNKTLTPFGFQNERRSVWDAQSAYLKASPFFFANKVKLPLLIIHGDDDANPGTTPLQATKLFEAIRGNGGTARLVMLPHEPHWYAAMESNEQLISEMLRWFDKHVKTATPREKTTRN